MELHRHAFTAMGSPCEVRLYGRAASAAVATAEAEVRRLEAKYSRYRDDSITAAINRSAGDARGIDVDEETAALLDYAATTHRLSGGLFDLTSGVLRRAWNFRVAKLPEPGAIEKLLPLVGWPQVRWERPRLVLPREGMEIDFGGVVKEYAADRAAQICREQGVAHGFVELGGDIALAGPHPDGAPWIVGVRHPRDPARAAASVALARGAIASSGDYERFIEVGGRRYGHILDPRTGWPVDGVAGVSVVADQCLVAGTATTVAMLKGEGAAAWLEELGSPYLLVDAAGTVSGTLRPLGGPAADASTFACFSGTNR